MAALAFHISGLPSTSPQGGPVLQYIFILSLSLSLSLSLRFNSHFPGEPGLASDDDGGGGDNWTTGAISLCKAPVKS